MDKYPKPNWAETQTIRLSGLVEDVCKHGVGHPNEKWLKVHPKLKHLAIHGCDGCCWGNRNPRKSKPKKSK